MERGGEVVGILLAEEVGGLCCVLRDGLSCVGEDVTADHWYDDVKLLS